MRRNTKSESEAKIHFELHRHLQNILSKGFTFEGITFERSEPEFSIRGIGFADIVIFDNKNHPWLVIEAKKDKAGHNRNFDPYSPKVVRQASQYATALGAPYFATYNGKKLILFQTYEAFKPLLQRSSKFYIIKNIEVFAEELLQQLIHFKQGSAKWDDLDYAFVARLHEFHARLSEKCYSSLSHILQNKTFKKEYEFWIKNQGWMLPKEEKKQIKTHKKFSEQAAYLLMNQILFYKILETKPSYRTKKLEPDSLKAFSDLPKFFADASKKIDFQAVFDHDKIFNSLKIEDFTNDLQDFVSELEDYDLTKFDSDVIGRVYEKVIPIEQRRSLGSYYTPPEIVRLIVDLTIYKHDDKILDPACGSGGFIVGSYHRLKKLKKKAGLPIFHKEITENLFGVDINRFPAHLTAINLALQDLDAKTERVNVEIADFFNIQPTQGRFATKIADITGEKSSEQLSIPTKVDVIIANPPYIPNQAGSGGIPNLPLIRKHLKNVNAENIPSLADIYVYFFTHSNEFIDNGGRIGFLTSDRWHMVDYGIQLREFLLNNFKILTIITFDSLAFEDVLMSTCVTIMVKEDEKLNRDRNIVKFIRLKQVIKHDDILTLVKRKEKSNMLYDNEQYRLVTKLQLDLREETKWHKFFFAPPLYFDLLHSGKLCTVNDITQNVSLGCMSGSNHFFYRKKDDLDELGISKKFFLPLMKSVGQADGINFGTNDTEWMIFNIHSWVEKALEELQQEGLRDDEILSELVKKKFLDYGFRDVVKFIELGEMEGHNKKSICAARSIWYDLGPLDIPPIIYPKEYWKKPLVFINKDKLAIDQHLYSITPKKGIDPILLTAILYSDIGTLFREVEGRIAGGLALSRNEITVGEVQDMKILDARNVNEKHAKLIIDSFKILMKNEKRSSESELKHMKISLNKTVLNAFGLKNRLDDLIEAIEDLLNRRIQSGGQKKKVMVQKKHKEIKQKLIGAEIVKTETLDNYF